MAKKKILLKTVVKSETVHFQVATLDGRPEINGAGNTEDEAIGNLVSKHQDRFDIEVVHP